MFLMIGVNDTQKELDFSQLAVCDACGAYGRYGVFMVCTVLSLFLIPILKWNRRYFVRMSCCGSVYRLDAEIGARIARGENVEIRPEHLQPVQVNRGGFRKCRYCGYSTSEDFEFCPKCGQRF